MQLIKTALGQAAFKERSAQFSARQRSIFILFDGNKSVEQVLAATSGMGSNQADVDHMLAQGFLNLVVPTVTAAPAVTEAVAPSAGGYPSHQERYALAMPLATKLTAGLGLFGVRLNLAVERASGYDDLLALFPKIQDAVGTKACQELERVLKG
jgi:hypothetical protein